MIFNRTYRIQSPLSINILKERLEKRQLKIHDLDFEISEKENVLKVIPRAENEEGVRTLPITHIGFQGNGSNGTKITLSSKPRKIDVGGPYLIIIFCLFCIIGASIFYWINSVEYFMPSISMMAVGFLIFVIFWIRMETGYFDYTRKIRNEIRDLVKSQSEQVFVGQGEQPKPAVS